MILLKCLSRIHCVNRFSNNNLSKILHPTTYAYINILKSLRDLSNPSEKTLFRKSLWFRKDKKKQKEEVELVTYRTSIHIQTQKEDQVFFTLPKRIYTLAQVVNPYGQKNNNST